MTTRREVIALSGAALRDGDDLGLGGAGLHDVADSLAGQRLGDRRDVGDRALRGIRLVLADDAEGLAATVLALDRTRRAEMRLRRVGRRGHDLRRVAPRRPVAQI